MNRKVGAPLAILLALSGLLALSPARAATQVEGNTYTSPGFPFELTWDDSWFLLEGPTAEGGFEDFTLANGASIVIFHAEADGIGNAQLTVSSILLGISNDPALANVQPLTDENGNGIRGGDASRAFGGITFTDEFQGETSEVVAYVEARALVPGESALSLLHVVPQQLYEQEAPLVQDLLTGLTITGQAGSDEGKVVESDDEDTPEPTAEPEPAEAPQALVSANWRVTVVAAQRDDAIADVGLEARDGKEWVVVIADITNWSGEADELAPRDIELRFREGDPSQAALRSTVSVADELDVGPDDVEQPVPFQPDETQRWALVYLVDEGNTDAALALRLAMSIGPVIESNVDLFDLPPVTDPPELIEAGVQVVRGGGALDVTTEPDGLEVRVELLGVDAPTGDDCFADESEEELQSLAEDTVFLEFPDGGEASDGPAYVWVERANGSRIQINRQMIAGGFASYDPADNGLFASWLGDSQASAENREIGLWETCAGQEAEPTEEVTPDDEEETPEPTAEPTEEATETPTEEATTEPTEEPTADATATGTPGGREQGRQQDDGDEPTDEPAAEGVMFRGNPARTGVQPGPGLGEPVTFPWQFSIGFPVLSSPAVVDGVVYIGSLNSEVYALDAFSGPPRWTFLTEGEVFSSPAVANGLVYVGSGDGNLYAINAETGTERWRFPTGNAVESSPAVVGGVVYVASGDTFLYAVDAATGEERWSFRIGPAFSSPAVVDGVVYIGAAQTLFAIDAQSGEEVWRFQTGDFLSSSPAVSNGLVYVGNDGGSVIAVDTASGEEVWRFQAGGPVLSSPAVADGMVFVGSDDRNVYGLDAETGEERWSFETGDAVSSSPAVDDGVVYVGGLDTFLYGLDAETGQELSRTQLGPILSSPAVVDGIIYVATTDGVVHARRPFDVLGIPGFGAPPAGTPQPE